jgi:RES domain-containing protein
MFVYRIASRRYAADNSEGARLYGGRWNKPGTAVIYAATTRSLAALEVIVHNGGIPGDYRVIAIELSGLAIQEIVMSQLPDRWPDEESLPTTANLGTEWVDSGTTAVLRVPSAVIPEEHNYILNPQHPEFKRIHFHETLELIDHRLQVK